MKPAEQTSIRYKLKFADDTNAVGEIINTVHKLAKHQDDAIAQYESTGPKTPRNLLPGLIQKINQGQKVDHRVTRLAAQFNTANEAVSDMVGKNSAYTSQWSGFLTLQERKQVQFAFEGQSPVGVELMLDDKLILSDKGTFGSKMSDSIQIDPGAHKLAVSYTHLTLPTILRV